MPRLFVGSLSWNIDAEALRKAFSQHGDVIDSFVCKDRETGRSRGFGFVAYSNSDDAEEAINQMDGKELDGRTIKVNVAKERSSGGNRSDNSYRASSGAGENLYGSQSDLNVYS